ncbi:MAG: hypothetical protein AVO39_10180 [delta proteobacterium MLS_D]|nr:MAG: hypothetical protein AVO39_10180 [delta proteobacterium MLS_D]
MGKYKAEVKEKAYELFMIQQMPFLRVVDMMKQDYPTFSKGTLTKWKNDPKLDWEGRYQTYCTAIAIRNDAELAKKTRPILDTLRITRQKVFEEIKDLFDDKTRVINEKNIGLVLSSFVRMCDLEVKMTGGAQNQTSAAQIVQVIIMVLEKDPNVGPVLTAHKTNIVDAIFEEIKEK